MDAIIQQFYPMIYETAKQTAGIIALEMSGIKDKIDFGNSTLGNIAGNGTIYYVVDDIVRYVSTGKSEILEMDPYKIGDGVGYNSFIFAIVDGAKVNKMVFNQIQRVSPFDLSINQNFARAGSMVGMKTIANIVRMTNKDNANLNYLFNPVSTILKPKKKMGKN